MSKKRRPIQSFILSSRIIKVCVILQILEVNGQSFEHGTRHTRALEILKGVCHLSITVKSNLLAFQEMLQTPEDTPRSRSRGKSTSGRIEDFANAESNGTSDGRSSSMSTVHSSGNSRDNTPTPSNRKVSPGSNPGSATPMKSKSKINRAFNRFLHKPKSLVNVDSLDGEGHSPSGSHSLHLYSNSMSNPDLLRDNSTVTHSAAESDQRTEYPEHVLKVYKSDQVRISLELSAT